MKKKFHNKKFLIRFCIVCIAAVALIGAASYTVFIKPLLSQDKYIYKEAEVSVGDLILGIMESGSVELQTSEIAYELDVDTTDDDEEDSSDEDTTEEDDEEESIKYLEIEDVYVAAGQRINEGDQLFKLSKDSVSAVRKNLESAVTEAEITLEEAQTEYNISALSAKSTYDSSIVDYNNAGTTYEAANAKLNLEIQGYTADISVLQMEIANLDEDLQDEDLWDSYEDAEDEYDTAKATLEDTSTNNTAAYAANYSAFLTAQSTYQNLSDQIKEKQESITEKQKSILEKQQNLADAQASLAENQLAAKQTADTSALSGQQAKDIYGYTVSTLEEAVTTAQTALDEAQETLDDFETFVGTDGIIYADGSGLVSAVAYETGDQLIDTGAMVTYVKEDAYTVSIDVSEEDIPSISVGDSVDIVFSAYPEESYKGTITAITTTLDSTSTTTVSYPVTIKIIGDTTKLYGGMTADVTFVTDSVNQVLNVSEKAIVYENEKAYVYQKISGDMTLVPVEVGFSDGANIEIKSGLKEGDIVYIASKISADQDENALKDTSESTAETTTEAESTEATQQSGMQNGMTGQMPSGGMPSGQN